MPATPAATRASESAVTATEALRVLVGRLRRRLQTVRTGDDLTPPQAAALIRLKVGGPASASQLAGAERVRPQSMAATLAGLERHGLIARCPDPDDGRRSLVVLTDRGRSHADDDHRARNDWLTGALQDRFTEAERQVINDALTLLLRITE